MFYGMVRSGYSCVDDDVEVGLSVPARDIHLQYTN
jgi:hypothetical protein